MMHTRVKVITKRDVQLGKLAFGALWQKALAAKF